MASNQYVVRYTTDGVNFDTAAFTGADGSFTDVRPTAFATDAPHSITVKVDGANQVAETDENDNTLSLGYTPIAPSTLPEKFLFPVAGTAN